MILVKQHTDKNVKIHLFRLKQLITDLQIKLHSFEVTFSQTLNTFVEVLGGCVLSLCECELKYFIKCTIVVVFLATHLEYELCRCSMYVFSSSAAVLSEHWLKSE